MYVKELIEQLQQMDPNLKVHMIWDGEPRNPVNIVYQSKSGHCMITGFNQVVYTDQFRPEGTNEENNPYWTTYKGEYEPDDELDF